MKRRQAIGTLGPLIAQGREAEVYGWGKNQVLKLFREGWDRTSVEREAEVVGAVHRSGLPVPDVGGVVESGGRHGIVFERFVGPSMLQEVMSRPRTLVGRAGLLVELHVAIHERSVPGPAIPTGVRGQQGSNGGKGPVRALEGGCGKRPLSAARRHCSMPRGLSSGQHYHVLAWPDHYRLVLCVPRQPTGRRRQHIPAYSDRRPPTRYDRQVAPTVRSRAQAVSLLLLEALLPAAACFPPAGRGVAAAGCGRQLDGGDLGQRGGRAVGDNRALSATLTREGLPGFPGCLLLVQRTEV